MDTITRKEKEKEKDDETGKKETGGWKEDYVVRHVLL